MKNSTEGDSHELLMPALELMSAWCPGGLTTAQPDLALFDMTLSTHVKTPPAASLAHLTLSVFK